MLGSVLNVRLYFALGKAYLVDPWRLSPTCLKPV